MANELIKVADFTAQMDSFAKAYALVQEVIGLNGDANTLNKASDNFAAHMLEYTEDDNNAWLFTDMGDAMEILDTNTTMGAYFVAPLKDAIRAIEKHGAKRSTAIDDINDLISELGTVVHPYCKIIYGNISAENVWPLSRDTVTGQIDSANQVPALGSFLVSGSGAGTYTAGTAIDTSVYGDGLIMARVTPAGGIIAGSDIVATVTGTDFAGSVVSGTITITAGASQYDEFDCASTRFASITATTITNGASPDAWDYEIRDDRVPTL